MYVRVRVVGRAACILADTARFVENQRLWLRLENRPNERHAHKPTSSQIYLVPLGYKYTGTHTYAKAPELAKEAPLVSERRAACAEARKGRRGRQGGREGGCGGGRRNTRWNGARRGQGVACVRHNSPGRTLRGAEGRVRVWGVLGVRWKARSVRAVRCWWALPVERMHRLG